MSFFKASTTSSFDSASASITLPLISGLSPSLGKLPKNAPINGVSHHRGHGRLAPAYLQTTKIPSQSGASGCSSVDCAHVLERSSKQTGLCYSRADVHTALQSTLIVRQYHNPLVLGHLLCVESKGGAKQTTCNVAHKGRCQAKVTRQRLSTKHGGDANAARCGKPLRDSSDVIALDPAESDSTVGLSFAQLSRLRQLWVRRGSGHASAVRCRCRPRPSRSPSTCARHATCAHPTLFLVINTRLSAEALLEVSLQLSSAREPLAQAPLHANIGTCVAERVFQHGPSTRVTASCFRPKELLGRYTSRICP